MDSINKLPLINIYFGSQTGCSEENAKTLQKKFDSFNIKSVIIDLKNFNQNEFIESKIVILLISSFGKGGPTDNAKEFYKWLSQQSGKPFENLRYGIFSMGNSKFKAFDGMGIQTNTFMLKLGGTLYDN